MDPPSKIPSTLALEDPRVGGIGRDVSQNHPGTSLRYGEEEKKKKKTPKKWITCPNYGPPNILKINDTPFGLTSFSVSYIKFFEQLYQ